MKRKSLVVLTLLVVAALMAGVGTGAIDVFSAVRVADAVVVNDADAFVSLSSTSAWAYEDGLGRLLFNFTDTNPNATGDGLNRSANSTFLNVFTITNKASKSAYFWLEEGPQWDTGPYPDTRDMVIYRINQGSTTGLITQSGHTSHSKYDILSKYVKRFVNGVVDTGHPGVGHSAYVLLAPGETMSIDIIFTMDGYMSNQSYWDRILDHNIRVMANVNAPQ